MLSAVINQVFSSIGHLFAESTEVQHAKRLACSSKLSEDQIRALIWAEQAGMLNSKVHALPCFKEDKQTLFPDRREIGDAVGFYFTGM